MLRTICSVVLVAGLTAAAGHDSTVLATFDAQATPQTDQTDQQAVKRRPPTPEPQRRAVPRRPSPPPVRVYPPRPPRPRVHIFIPIGTSRGWFYHPYFGFYYGPYYGPFTPFPDAYDLQHDFAVVRTRVEPRETLVYVDGYFAGEVDDFDGLFQRLYLPPGSHVIEFVLDGYETFRDALFFNLDDSREIRHRMRPLRAAERATPPMSPTAAAAIQAVPALPAPAGRRSTPLGVLTLLVDPLDAVIEIDGETWTSPGPNHELVIHLTPGRHEVYVSKAGYQPFETAIELSEGSATKLTVQLRR